MNDRWNIFDEYGHKIGTLVPQNNDILGALGAMLTIGILWLVGFVFYAFFKLIAKGFGELANRHYSQALGYLLVPILVFSVFWGFIVTGVVASQNQIAQAQQDEQIRIMQQTQAKKIEEAKNDAELKLKINVQSELQKASDNPTIFLSASKIPYTIKGVDLPVEKDQDRWLQGLAEESLYEEFLVTNNSRHLIYSFWSSVAKCVVLGTGFNNQRVEPQKSVTVFCAAAGPMYEPGSRARECWPFRVFPVESQYGSGSKEGCWDFP